jgi:hypothetical protein
MLCGKIAVELSWQQRIYFRRVSKLEESFQKATFGSICPNLGFTSGSLQR